MENKLKIYFGIITIFISAAVSLATYSVTAGKWIQSINDQKRQFNEYKKSNEQRWKDREKVFDADHDLLIRIDANVTTIKEDIKDLN